jgi:hypothetical protein
VERNAVPWAESHRARRLVVNEQCVHALTHTCVPRRGLPTAAE